MHSWQNRNFRKIPTIWFTIWETKQTGLSTYLHQLPLDHRKVGELEFESLAAVLLLHFFVILPNLKHWFITLKRHHHLLDANCPTNLSQPDASARFCSTESKSLRLKTMGIPRLQQGQLRPTPTSRGKNHEEFHPAVWLDYYLPWAINAITIYGICTYQARGQSSDHLLHNSWEKLLGWSLYCRSESLIVFVVKNCGDQDSPIRGRIKE